MRELSFRDFDEAFGFVQAEVQLGLQSPLAGMVGFRLQKAEPGVRSPPVIRGPRVGIELLLESGRHDRYARLVLKPDIVEPRRAAAPV